MLSAYADLRRNVRFFWYRADKAAWFFALFTVCVIGGLVFALQAVFAYQDERRERQRAFHNESLACLARNVYFEARGEPIAGQFAVAEVTMNRKGSRLFPRTVCEVVYQQTWDPLRKRMVGAFSWTEFKKMPGPGGDEWLRAQQVAEAVYYNRYTPQLQGALYFHASYIRPDWAKEKRRVARIGRHVFYK
jgi:spore germination cell wall hydrolase CwlJ-like protein